MKNSIIKMFFLLSFFLTLTLPAIQNKSDFKNLLEGIALSEKAIILYDKELLLQVKAGFEKNNSTSIALYYQTFCEYKLLEMSTRPGNEDLFDKFYDNSLSHAEKLVSIKEYESEGKTLLAGIYMMKIATNPMSAVTLTSKIHSLLDDVQKTNPENPRSYIIRGIMKFQTPGIFGGSYEEAAKNFSKAIQLFEKENDVDQLQPHWGYLESLAWMGKTQEKLENLDAAQFVYQKALKVEPNFAWIKYSLLPKLLEKQKINN